VRPILSDKCFGCHGPDSVGKEDPAAAWIAKGAASSVVAGGAQAKLIQRITADDKASRMPPVYSGLSLTAYAD
jgi:mono/diheme cytochrome c family protein